LARGCWTAKFFLWFFLWWRCLNLAWSKVCMVIHNNFCFHIQIAQAAREILDQFASVKAQDQGWTCLASILMMPSDERIRQGVPAFWSEGPVQTSTVLKLTCERVCTTTSQTMTGEYITTRLRAECNINKHKH
jgi:hypothetical protein